MTDLATQEAAFAVILEHRRKTAEIVAKKAIKMRAVSQPVNHCNGETPVISPWYVDEQGLPSRTISSVP